MWNFLALTFCLMVGTAGLPHILTRYYTSPSVRQARTTCGWALFCIFLLYFTAPAYAAFARFALYTRLVGTKITELPGWVNLWKPAGLFDVVDKNGDGIVQWADFVLKSSDFVVLATPEIAGLPFVITGLVMAGGLAAALSTADGLLLTIANAISHDLYYNVIDPSASLVKRLTITKVLLVVTAVVAAYIATYRLSLIVELVAWAFSLAGASFFPALVMGIWWKRANAIGANVGMLVGLGVTLFYMIGSRFYGMSWFGTPDDRLRDLRAAGGLPDDLDRVAADGAAAPGGPGPRGERALSEVGAGHQGRPARPRPAGSSGPLVRSSGGARRSPTPQRPAIIAADGRAGLLRLLLLAQHRDPARVLHGGGLPRAAHRVCAASWPTPASPVMWFFARRHGAADRPVRALLAPGTSGAAGPPDRAGRLRGVVAREPGLLRRGSGCPARVGMLALAAANAVGVVLFGTLYAFAGARVLSQLAFIGLSPRPVRPRDRRCGSAPRRVTADSIPCAGSAASWWGSWSSSSARRPPCLTPLFWLDAQLPAEAGLRDALGGVMALVLITLVLVVLVNVTGSLRGGRTSGPRAARESPRRP